MLLSWRPLQYSTTRSWAASRSPTSVKPAGLINEDINKLSKAENLYMQAVINSLAVVNDSYGDELPQTLNEYFLLGRLWQQEQRTKLLLSLDRVYTLLEQRVLVNLKDKERKVLLHEQLSRLEQLHEEKKQLQKQLDQQKERNRATHSNNKNKNKSNRRSSNIRRKSLKNRNKKSWTYET